MPLPRCPACGSIIFPSARDGGDVSPLCEGCQTRAATTGHTGPSLTSPPPIRQEVLEPSGPFLIPQAPPPPDVLEHLGVKVHEATSRTAEDDGDGAAVIEPSGPFTLPGGSAAPVAGVMETPSDLGSTAPAPPSEVPLLDADEVRDDEDEDDAVVVEPSGPFVVPGLAGPTAPLSLDESAATGLDEGQVARGGFVRGAVRPHLPMDAEGPSVVVDPALGARTEATLELPRAVRDAVRDALDAGQSAPTPWTALAIAFAAGMLAGAAIVLAVLRL